MTDQRHRSSAVDAGADRGEPETLFAPDPAPARVPPRRPQPGRRGRPRAVAPFLPLAWRCVGCDAEVMEPGSRCDACEDRAHARWVADWATELALRVELGEDAFAGQWYENDGDPDDRQATIAARVEPPPGAMSARAYDAWCEAYWLRWGLVRLWTGLPPELPLVRWVETWYFDVPIEEFDPESDVEIRGYPARPVIDVATGSYL